MHSRFILRDITIGGDYVFTELLHRMHRAAIYFTKSSLGRFASSPRQAWKTEMKELWSHYACMYAYAQYLETEVDEELLKSNLHVVLCRLPWQIICRGHSGDESELWVERAAGFLRKVTRNRTTKNAEQALMKAQLDKAALNRFTDRHGV